MSAYGKYAIVFGLLGGTLQSAWLMSSASGYVSQSNSERPPPLSARSASTGCASTTFGIPVFQEENR